MPKSKRYIEVQGHEVAIIAQGPTDFISLTNIARYRNSQEPFAVINNWMRSRSSIEFIGPWEKLCNPLLNLSNSGGLKKRQYASEPRQTVTGWK
jgi:hypothetical protein